MPHFNSVTFIGHLARDPELRYTQSGTAVCGCAMGVNYGWGENKDSFFVDFSIWGKRGEAFDQICNKGDAVLIQGELQEDKWTDKQSGEERKKLTVKVSEWQKISTPKRGGPSEGDGKRKRDASPVVSENELDSIPF